MVSLGDSGAGTLPHEPRMSSERPSCRDSQVVALPGGNQVVQNREGSKHRSGIGRQGISEFSEKPRTPPTGHGRETAFDRKALQLLVTQTGDGSPVL